MGESIDNTGVNVPKEGINVVSLFDGMGCLYVALKESGVKVNKYFAYEVDKHAVKQTKHNFPDIIHLGDVRKASLKDFGGIDIHLIGGGSPCTSFSFAGKRNGMSTKCNEEILTLKRYLELKEEGFEFEGQSYLFWEYMRILEDIRKSNPDVLFLLENVEMGKKWERVLSEAVGIYGVHINSALVSAQNRKRIYWTNIKVKKVGLFGELHTDIPQPEDRGILLKDVLEKDVDEKYYLSDKMVKSLTDWGERNANNGNGFKPEIREVDEKSAVVTTGSMKSSSTYVKVDKKLNPKPSQDKASCFTAGGNSGGNHSDMDLICVAMRGRNPNNPSDRTTGAPTEQRLEPNATGKTNCLTSVQKDNLVMQLNPSLESGGKQPYQQNRIYDSEGISPALCANKADLIIREATSKGYTEIKPGECFDNENPNSKTRRGRRMESKSNALMSQNMSLMNYTNDYRIRRLTPTECARLQTVPEWYSWEPSSDTQVYKMLGNGWTIAVISWIFSFFDEK